MPELIAAMVYVDFAPGKGALAPDFDGAEKPMNWEEIAEEENLNGLSEEQLETFRQRAVPEPGGHPARGRSAEQRCAPRYPDHDHLHGLPVRAGQTYAQEHDWAWLAGVAELRDITWVDLPTSHWPMWSRPQELAQLIGNVAENTRRPA